MRKSALGLLAPLLITGTFFVMTPIAAADGAHAAKRCESSYGVRIYARRYITCTRAKRTVDYYFAMGDKSPGSWRCSGGFDSGACRNPSGQRFAWRD